MRGILQVDPSDAAPIWRQIEEGLHRLVAAGVLLYGGVGIAAIFAGGNFLDYDVLAHDPHHGQHLGILLVELGVGITVAAVMMTIYTTFAGRDEEPR